MKMIDKSRARAWKVEREPTDTQLWRIRKVFRFALIYGPLRTFFKVVARLRQGPSLPGSRRTQDIGVIGCGQFAFSTIGYFIWSKYGKRFKCCFDSDADAQASFAQFFGCSGKCEGAAELLSDPSIDLVYIASNHATHTDYAVDALNAGKTAYIEKPVSVSRQQLRRLALAVRTASAAGTRTYAGYNRPFSGAVRLLRRYCNGQKGPLTLSCFVTGHEIAANHWYRKPEEGTRVCGNVGHWIDLAVHMLSWRSLPDRWQVLVASADAAAPDDNLSISMTSEHGDLISLVLTSRSEPFEGINETLNLQWGEVMGRIDDFRAMRVWVGSRRHEHRFWPKDVGHRRAILQPFNQTEREWKEVEQSSLLMLAIADMILTGDRERSFSFADERASCGLP